MSNFDEVSVMDPGTIFHFGGAPWMRTEDGVTDLIPYLLGDRPIPERWNEFDYPVTIIYTPGESNE